MIKKIFLIVVLALSGNLSLIAEEKAQPTQKEQVIAQLTTGPISKRTEKLVRELLEKFGIDTTDPEIAIAQPSALAKELNPVIELPATVIPPYQLYLINEKNFNKLSQPEKEVLIASNVVSVLKSNGWKIPGTTLSIPKEMAGYSTFMFFVILLLEILLGIAIYKALGKKTKLTRIKRIFIAFVVIMILDGLHEVWKRKSANPMAKVYDQDKKIVELIGSPDGYITYLKRMQKDVQELKKSANFNFWQNIEAALAPRIKYLESLKQ